MKGYWVGTVVAILSGISLYCRDYSWENCCQRVYIWLYIDKRGLKSLLHIKWEMWVYMVFELPSNKKLIWLLHIYKPIISRISYTNYYDRTPSSQVCFSSSLSQYPSALAPTLTSQAFQRKQAFIFFPLWTFVTPIFCFFRYYLLEIIISVPLLLTSSAW